MKIIAPSEISGKIMTLIERAREFLVIVSPYNNVSNWTKLVRRIEKAQDRGIKISWYVRGNNVSEENFEEVLKLGINPTRINDLHAKLYLNESQAIITSMNLTQVSDDKSLDIGLVTETDDEFDSIYTYYKDFIKIESSDDRSLSRNKGIREELENGDDDEELVEILKVDKRLPRWAVLLREHFYEKHNKDIRFFYSEEYDYWLIEDHGFKEEGYQFEIIQYRQALKLRLGLPETYNLKEKRLSFNRLRNDVTYMEELSLLESRYEVVYFFRGELIVEEWSDYKIKGFFSDLEKIFKVAIK